ncbi:UNVERIFIED_CONTAM: ribosomal protein S6--L-glutamate ligase/gamma-F420-2:alpha-L-glutamate ligase [Acetivibrio alkalicellulosi]
MEAWLIYDRSGMDRNINYINFYFEECNKRNINLKLLLTEDIKIVIRENKCTIIYKNEIQKMPKFVVCRTINSLLTKHLEMMGIAVFNNSFVSSVCNDKQKSYQYISLTGIKIMDSIFTDCSYCEDIDYPVIVKPSNGYGGQNVFLVNNKKEFENAVRNMQNTTIVIQKVASDLGKDLRVYVIGDEIVASMLRVSKSDFRSNYCLGGSAKLYHLNNYEKSIVHKVIDMFDFGLVGIDFVFDNGELTFNEIEDVVGSRMLYSKTDINIVSMYLDYILSIV